MKIRAERAAEKPKERPRRKLPWPLRVSLTTFAIAGTMGVVSELSISVASLPVVVLVLVGLIAVGVLFDVVGTAATACAEPPLISMASKRVRGAKDALKLVRNADRVSNICNDVVGDICGIVSGTAAAALSLKLTQGLSGVAVFLISTAVTGMTSALTVGGKSSGKHFAISRSRDIMLFIGRIAGLFRP